MPNRVTVTVPADHLPEEVRAELREHPLPGSRFRVTAELIEDTDDEKQAALQAILTERRAQVTAGEVVDGETMFARMREKHFPSAAD